MLHSNIVIPNPSAHTYPDEMPTEFSTLLIDPPWDIQQKGKYGAASHYDLMTMKEIKALPINELLTDNACVWLWITNAIIPYVGEILKAWGLTYRSNYTWCKTKTGLGIYLRNSTEHLVLATKGKVKLLFHGQISYGFFPVQDHSHKPEEIYPMIERCYFGPYLELFGRQRFPFWYVWGNEIPSDIAVENQPVPEYTEHAREWLTKKLAEATDPEQIKKYEAMLADVTKKLTNPESEVKNE